MDKIKPNFTMVPNVYFDEILNKIDGGEAKILFFLCRKIYGFHKKGNKDIISYSQIRKFTGMNNSSISRAIKNLIDKKLISKKTKGVGRGLKIEYSLIYGTESIPIGKIIGTESIPIISTESGPITENNGTESGHTKESNINKTTKEKKESDKSEPSLRRIISDRITQETLNYTDEKIIWPGKNAKLLTRITNILSSLPEEKRLPALERRISNLREKIKIGNNNGFWVFTISKLLWAWEELGLSRNKKTGIDTKLRDEILERHGIK